MDNLLSQLNPMIYFNEQFSRSEFFLLYFILLSFYFCKHKEKGCVIGMFCVCLCMWVSVYVFMFKMNACDCEEHNINKIPNLTAWDVEIFNKGLTYVNFQRTPCVCVAVGIFKLNLQCSCSVFVIKYENLLSFNCCM